MDLIIESLVGAGYFRARISTLSDFDKVIGGMAWAMQVFSQEIDINIFYKDTLDLGQKIALTERLVMVLLVMKCPYKIEPHQIVGLDHDNLLPVIKWLIKRSAEIRREHEAFNRLLALRHYHRVTNTLANRDQWCHVLKTDQLRAITSKRVAGPSSTSTSPEKCDIAESDLMKRLRTEFKDNQLISFVNSQSVYMSNVQDDDQAVDSALRANSFEDDTSEDESVIEQSDRATITKPDIQDVASEGNSHEEQAAEEVKPIIDESEDSPEIIAIHKELDTELLATNQKILTLLKKLDSMPSDLEIIQYQRRYIELHQELISKNKDLKKIYALFNSLDSVRHYLNKEMNLLSSIMSNLELTTNNPNNRYEFLRQFQEIITKIQAVRGEVDGRLQQMRKKYDTLQEEYVNSQRAIDEDS